MNDKALLAEIYDALLTIEKNEEHYQKIFEHLPHDDVHWGMSYGRCSASNQILEIFKKHNYQG